MPCAHPRCADGGGAGRPWVRRRGVHGFGHFGRNQSASSAGTRPGDSEGNRTSDLNANGIPRDYVYTPGTNRLVQIRNQLIELDAAGFTQSDHNGQRVFTYNGAGRLAQVTRQGIVAGTYRYNYLGQRTQKRRSNALGQIQRFIYHYDLQGNLIAETRPNGRLVRSYLWANDQPLAQIQNRPALGTEELIYIHTDHLNTPRLATDPTQTIVWRFDSEAFGTGKPDTDPDADADKTHVRLGFPGQYHDGESGLHYNWNRYYDPRLGRYITSDPIGLEGGLNTFSYVYNNPLRWTDPSGLEVRFICRRLSGVLRLSGYQHCFVRVTCPEEGWATTLSLFGTNPNLIGVPQSGSKGRDDPDDNPASPNNSFNEPVDPGMCPINTCAFEKAVLGRYNSFPNGDVPYSLNGPNSNSFANDLVTGAPGFPTTLPPGAPNANVAPGINIRHPNFP